MVGLVVVLCIKERLRHHRVEKCVRRSSREERKGNEQQEKFSFEKYTITIDSCEEKKKQTAEDFLSRTSVVNIGQERLDAIFGHPCVCSTVFRLAALSIPIIGGGDGVRVKQ